MLFEYKDNGNCCILRRGLNDVLLEESSADTRCRLYENGIVAMGDLEVVAELLDVCQMCLVSAESSRRPRKFGIRHRPQE
jgi:hypothetical protein